MTLVPKLDTWGLIRWNLHDFYNTKYWHILWNENLTLQLSYDLVLGCSPFFSNSIDYDSSYPWIRLTFMHLMGVRPVQTYCWKKVWTSHLPSPTYNVIICQLFFAHIGITPWLSQRVLLLLIFPPWHSMNNWEGELLAGYLYFSQAQDLDFAPDYSHYKSL